MCRGRWAFFAHGRKKSADRPRDRSRLSDGATLPLRVRRKRLREAEGLDGLACNRRPLWAGPVAPPKEGGKGAEPADKPGSVVSSHSSGIRVTAYLERPTRVRRGPRHRTPIWSCSGWGLPCRTVLPRARCALTAPFHPYLTVCTEGGLFSVALSVDSRPPGVTWHPALWSPDFPPSNKSRATA